MNRNHLVWVLLLSLICSCTTTRYYVCVVDQPLSVFQDAKRQKIVAVIEANKRVIKTVHGWKMSVQRGIIQGYISKKHFPLETEYSKRDVDNLVFGSDGRYSPKLTWTEEYDRDHEASEYISPTIGGGQGRSPSTKNSPGTEVHVSGYYRKNGTYVKPYTRSAPHRK